MENVKEYIKNKAHHGKIRYISNSGEDIYARSTYKEFGKESFRWVNHQGIEAPTSLYPLFESVFKNSQLKSGKLEALVIHMKIEE